jgi:hypothetical protein
MGSGTSSDLDWTRVGSARRVLGQAQNNSILCCSCQAWAEDPEPDLDVMSGSRNFLDDYSLEDIEVRDEWRCCAHNSQKPPFSSADSMSVSIHA